MIPISLLPSALILFVFFLQISSSISVTPLPPVGSCGRRRSDAHSLTFQIRGGAKASAKKVKTSSPPTHSSSQNKIITKIFDDADTNSDGTINLSELYELILVFYININRQAPIPPPTRETVNRLYYEFDKDRNKSISRDEFAALISKLGKRAAIKIATFKTFSLIVAPLLAEYMVHKFTGKPWLKRVREFIIPSTYLQNKLFPIISTKTFARTFLIAIFVSTLGTAALKTVSTIMNMSLPKLYKEEKGDGKKSK